MNKSGATLSYQYFSSLSSKPLLSACDIGFWPFRFDKVKWSWHICRRVEKLYSYIEDNDLWTVFGSFESRRMVNRIAESHCRTSFQTQRLLHWVLKPSKLSTAFMIIVPSFCSSWSLVLSPFSYVQHCLLRIFIRCRCLDWRRYAKLRTDTRYHFSRDFNSLLGFAFCWQWQIFERINAYQIRLI